MGQASEFNLKERLDVLRRGSRLLTLFVVSAMVSALVYTYVFTERYRARTTILYRPNTDVRLDGINPQQRTFGFPVPAVYPFEALGLTIKQVGTSERVLRPVVVELGLDQPDDTPRSGLNWLYHETKEGVRTFGNKTWEVLKHGRTIDRDPTSEAIEELAANTTIDTMQKNYAATLTVVDKNPARAARIVDRIAEEMVKFLREQSVESSRQQGKELDDRLAEKKSEIDRTRAAVQALKTTSKFISMNDETSLHLKTAEDIEVKLLTYQTDLDAARARLKSLVSQRDALASMSKSSETVADDPVYNRLREMKASLEVELKGLLERSPKDHPDVRSAQARLRTTEELLTAAKQTRISQVSTELSKVYQNLQAEETKVRSEVAGLEAAHASMAASLEKARARVTKPEVEANYNDLQLQLVILESDYKKLATLREEVRASELTSKAEVSTLHAATRPDSPFRPIKVYHVLAAGLLALFLGVGVIYLLDYLGSLAGAARVKGGPAAA